MSNLIDLTGKTFGRLKVLEKAPSTGGQAEWICICECGNKKKVKGGHLRNGTIQSCGCLNRERTSLARTVDLVGKRFGKLTAEKYIGSKNGRAVWRCKCDCGNYIETYSSYLRVGDTKSCGCVISYREVIIAKFLNEHHIPYKQQYTFADLIGKRYPLRFDFAIFNDDSSLKCLIEYQGEAHFSNIFCVPDNDYKMALKRDVDKRRYCKKNQIQLYEISKETEIESTLERMLL